MKVINNDGFHKKQNLEGKVLEANIERKGARLKVEDRDGNVEEIKIPFNEVEPKDVLGYRIFYELEERQRAVEIRTNEVYFDNDGIGFVYESEVWIDANHMLVIMDGPCLGNVYKKVERERVGKAKGLADFLRGHL